jgi:RNase H-fold protein (predicted Holliday junction resolvase)
LEKCDKANTASPEEQLVEVNYTLVDENWTTKEATSKLKDIELTYAKWGHLHKEKQLLDGMAAMNILQKYLTYYNS